jgi:non-heme chloroperoxidase
MDTFIADLAWVGFVILTGFVAAVLLIASSPPKIDKPLDIFGFANLTARAAAPDIPAFERFMTRTGEELAYRVYDSSSERILIFVHGSSYHGAGYHGLASSISSGGAAKVILPNLRGHLLSGRRRGDVDYIGQLEDDLADLVRHLRGEGFQGPIVLGGHSSGGGLAIRFAGGTHNDLVSSYLILSPIIPTSPAVRLGTSGGWTSLHKRRLFGLLFLNVFRMHGLDGLSIIEFNKPAKYWDGTETLSYSHRLNASYHPPYRYAGSLRALDGKALVLVGSDDEAVDPDALRDLFASNAPHSQVIVLPAINHFGIFTEAIAVQTIGDWLRGLPAG